MAEPIYLDHHATTPIDPRVLRVLVESCSHVGNASNLTHVAGREAHTLVQASAEIVKRSIGAGEGAAGGRLLWTSGATEANNLALLGGVDGSARIHVLHGATEHASVLAPMAELGARGAVVESVRVAADGRLEVGAVLDRIKNETRLASFMLANNEVGVLHPVAEIVRAAKLMHPLVRVHCDASQAMSHVPIDVQELGVDYLSISAHKVYGPVGIGALWVRDGAPLRPVAVGGGQQEGLRAGTLPLALAAALAEACRVAVEVRAEEAVRVRRLRDALLEGLRRELGDVAVTGSMTHRLPGNLHVWFEGIDTTTLLEGLPGLAASTAAACSGHERHASHVLMALGHPERAFQSVRFGLGRGTTRRDVEGAVEQVSAGVRALRALAPVRPYFAR